MLRSQLWRKAFHRFTDNQKLKHDRRLRFIIGQKRYFVHVTLYIAGLFEQPWQCLARKRDRSYLTTDSLSSRENFKGGESGWNCDRSPVY